MRISVNLASRPFIELRPFFARLRIIMAVLAALAIGFVVAMHFEQKKLDVAQHQMDIVRNRTVAAQEEKRHNEARMRQPANAAVLDRAHFLNALFLRKSFSWTAVMMDLENVLPTGVQVTAIEPSITLDGDVVIRLRVSGDRDRAVQLVRNLERSSRFLAPRLSNETTQTKEQAAAAAASGAAPGGVEFDILANYNPLPAPVAGATTKPDKAAGATDNATKPNVKRAPKPGPHDGVVLKPYVAPRTVPAKPTGGAR
jgi:type IV pilus assembly protein PilN